MDVRGAEKRLREAQFFLQKMRDEESRVSGDRDPFDFYLSAFLGAARLVDHQLRQEQWAIYPRWREAWDSRLPDSERDLIKSLVEARDMEVREGERTPTAPTRVIPVDDSNTDSSGKSSCACPPSRVVVAVVRPRYWFTIGGSTWKTTEACAQYLELLARMVEAFRALP